MEFISFLLEEALDYVIFVLVVVLFVVWNHTFRDKLIERQLNNNFQKFCSSKFYESSKIHGLNHKIEFSDKMAKEYKEKGIYMLRYGMLFVFFLISLNFALVDAGVFEKDVLKDLMFILVVSFFAVLAMAGFWDHKGYHYFLKSIELEPLVRRQEYVLQGSLLSKRLKSRV